MRIRLDLQPLVCPGGVPRFVVITCKIHKYIASSPIRSFNNVNRLVEHRFRLLFGTKSLYFENKKNAMTSNYRVISSAVVYVWSGTRRIVCARNSQMASSLSLVRVLCTTLKISSFPQEIEKNIQAMKISRMLHSRRTRDRSKKSSMARLRL